MFSLGVILYEMLTGERPHPVEKSSVIDALRMICSDSRRPLRETWPGHGEENGCVGGSWGRRAGLT